MNTQTTISSTAAQPLVCESMLCREAAKGVNSLAQDMSLSTQSRLRSELPFTYTYYGFGGDPQDESASARAPG